MKTAVASTREAYPNEILLEIDGLKANADGSFSLVGVRPVDLDYKNFEALVEAMINQGVPRNLAARLTDEAHGAIQMGLLSDAIAQRTRRVG